MSKVLATASTPVRAIVVVTDAKKPTRGIKKVSNIVIAAGPLTIATRTIGGEFNETTALADFRQNQRQYTPAKDFNTAKTLGIVK